MTRVVLDASVGVKWFRDEPGADEARELLHEHGRGEISILVPSLFVYEFAAVAASRVPGEGAEEVWERFVSWRINVCEVGDALVRDALELRRELGCGFYDAVAPALARQLRAPLYSADRRAHGSLEGVVLLG